MPALRRTRTASAIADDPPQSSARGFLGGGQSIVVTAELTLTGFRLQASRLVGQMQAGSLDPALDG